MGGGSGIEFELPHLGFSTPFNFLTRVLPCLWLESSYRFAAVRCIGTISMDNADYNFEYVLMLMLFWWKISLQIFYASKAVNNAR